MKKNRLIILLLIANIFNLSCLKDPNHFDERGYAAIHLAVKSGDIDEVRELIEDGADVNRVAQDKNKSHPLFFAIMSKNINMVKLLVENKANVNYQDEGGATPLMWASWSKQDEIVEYLLKNNANPNFVDYTGYSAIYTQSLKGIYLLAKYGARVDVRNQKGKTPKEEFKEIDGDPFLWEVLTAKDIKETVSLRNENRQTPLHLAIMNKADWLAEILIEAGADVNAVNKYGDTPLHYAVRNENLDAVKKLVEKGADINVKDANGSALICYAVLSEQNIPVLEYLIQKGAQVNLKNKDGKTVLDQDIKSQKIKESLIKAGAKTGAQIK